MSPARERLAAVLAVVATGAAAVLVSTQRFAALTLPPDLHVSVTGSAVAPVLAPLGLAAVALAAALTIAGPAARRVLAVVLVLLGAGLIGAAVPAGLHPAAGIGAAVTKQIGETGPHALAVLTAPTEGTVWPWVGAVDGLLVALTGVLVLVRSPRWPAGGRRFRAASPVRPASSDPVEEWDALTAGADPTEAAASADPTAPTAPAEVTPPEP